MSGELPHDATWHIAGSLSVVAYDKGQHLLGDPVRVFVDGLDPDVRSRLGVAAIDPELADTAAFCAEYGSPMSASANCVVVSGRREGEVRFGACLVLATTRADVNGVVRRRLDVRKASFAPMAEAVELTGMEYGGITPLGLPSTWPILVDARVAIAPELVIGSGLRGSKILIPGDVLAALPGAEVIENLAG